METKKMAPKNWMTDKLKRGETRVLKQSDMLKCFHYLLDPINHFPDGKCRCKDPIHPAMEKWGYVWSKEKRHWEDPQQIEEEGETLS